MTSLVNIEIVRIYYSLTNFHGFVKNIHYMYAYRMRKKHVYLIQRIYYFFKK